MSEIKLPLDVTIDTTGKNGNAFLILGRVRQAMLNAGFDEKAADDFFQEAMSGDYDHLLKTAEKYVHLT